MTVTEVDLNGSPLVQCLQKPWEQPVRPSAFIELVINEDISMSMIQAGGSDAT
jgi:hypothetical protein